MPVAVTEKLALAPLATETSCGGVETDGTVTRAVTVSVAGEVITEPEGLDTEQRNQSPDITLLAEAMESVAVATPEQVALLLRGDQLAPELVERCHW